MCVTCKPLLDFATPKDYDGFVNLHLHSSLSLLDGLSKPEDIIKKIVSIKQQSVAISEHGNVFSSVKVHKLAKKENIKHIYGMEAYVTKDRFVQDKSNKYSHLTILAKNEAGRLNLNKLSSLGYLEGFYSKPRIDHQLLEQYKEGLIVLSGCPASEVQKALTGGDYDNFAEITESNKEAAKSIIQWYRKTFGRDYYLEIQAHRDPRQQKINRAIVDIAIELSIEYVATTDSHYTNEEDKELHSIFIQIGTSREAGETYDDCFIMSSQQVYDRLDSLEPNERELSIRTSLLIADKCNVTIPLSEPIIPKNEVPDGFDNEADYLKELITRGWKKRQIKKKENIKLYKERLNYEFNAITKMGFEGYFLLVESYANSVTRRGIARGSSGGSLIAWLLGITDIDPIRYGLYFERFIDVGALDQLEAGTITRKELKIPDVDSDFGTSDRDAVVNGIIKKYGEKKVAAIGQFGYIWDKSAVKDVGRVLGVPYAVTNMMTKQMGDLTISYMREAGLFSQWFEEYPKLFEYAEKLAGLPKSFGVHPCGKIIAIKDVDYYTAVASNDGTIVFQGDMDDTDDLGLVKVDILGLRSIDVIYDTLKAIGKDYEYINPDTLDFSDPNILKLFQEGRTGGIFQFESVGMKETLRKVLPDRIDDLGVVNALFRPSSMKFIDHYANRKNGSEKVSYLHPDLENILMETFGIWVFQEQMITLAKLSGMRSPDTIRKAIGKKLFSLMEKCKDELFDGLRNRGWSEDQLLVLWQNMIDFSSYSFNKAHSSAYAIIAWQMAKLKHYHPLEFMIALLNSKLGKIEQLSNYIGECKRMGIKVNVPDINNSQALFTAKDGEIQYGLLALRGIGEPTVELIQKVREYNQHLPISSLVHFNLYAEAIGEAMPVDSIICLIKSGAFGTDKNEMLIEYFESMYVSLQWIPKKTVPTKKDFDEKKYSITSAQFSDKELRKEVFNKQKHADYLIKDATRKEKQATEFTKKYIGDVECYEFDTMGAYLTISPFDKYQDSIHDFYSYEDETDKVLVVGTIIGKEVKKSSRGGQFAKLQILTPHGVVQAKVYATQYSEYKNLFEKGLSIVMLAKRNKDEAIVSKVKTFAEWTDIIEKIKARKIKDESKESVIA